MTRQSRSERRPRGIWDSYVLRLADSSLIHAQRLCEWITRAPTLEEEMALGNVAIDLLGHAKMLYEQCLTVENDSRVVNDLIFSRAAPEYLNYKLVEISNGDFARTVVKELLYATYCSHLYEDLANSPHIPIAQFARSALPDIENHVLHARQWATIFSRGTKVSRAKLRAASQYVFVHSAQLFEEDGVLLAVVEAGIMRSPKNFYPQWRKDISTALSESGFSLPGYPFGDFRPRREPAHISEFAEFIANMQSVHSSIPEGVW